MEASESGGIRSHGRRPRATVTRNSCINVEAVVLQLQEQCATGGSQWRIATPYYKPANNRTGLVPDYYLVECEEWLVFPHELSGLSDAELRSGKPGLGGLRERIASLRHD